MTELPQQLQEAIDRLELPAREMVELSSEWRRVLFEGEQRAERIRQQVADSVCRCEYAPPPDAAGRCKLCLGWQQ